MNAERSQDNPLTPRQACYLRLACDVVSPGLLPSAETGRHGRYTSNDWPLSELPDWVLFIVNSSWCQRFLMVFADIGVRVSNGEVPYPRCTAEQVALWIVVRQARRIADDIAEAASVALLDADADLPAADPTDDDWGQIHEALFDGDLDFRFIWRCDATRLVLHFLDEQSTYRGDSVSQYHPYRWWEKELTTNIIDP